MQYIAHQATESLILPSLAFDFVPCRQLLLMNNGTWMKLSWLVYILFLIWQPVIDMDHLCYMKITFMAAFTLQWNKKRTKSAIDVKVYRTVYTGITASTQFTWHILIPYASNIFGSGCVPMINTYPLPRISPLILTVNTRKLTCTGKKWTTIAKFCYVEIWLSTNF